MTERQDDLWRGEIHRLEQLMEERDRRYENQFKAQDDKTSLALASSKEAVNKAETATEKRFEGVNEFRAALSDNAAMLIPRSEAQSRFASMEEKMQAMKESQNVVREELMKEVHSLRESRSESGGKSATWMLVIALLSGILGSVVSGLIVSYLMSK